MFSLCDSLDLFGSPAARHMAKSGFPLPILPEVRRSVLEMRNMSAVSVHVIAS